MDTEHPLTQHFMDALHALEDNGDLEALSALITADAPVHTIGGLTPGRGPEGIKELFSHYLDQFDTITTTFTSVTESPSRAALAWTSDATLSNGHEIHYDGVTLIDLEGDQVSSFSTIYDSAALMGPPKSI